MKRVLITGAAGQMGQCLLEAGIGFGQLELIAADRSELDITDKDQVMEFFRQNSFDFCINAAAYTQVDKAESEPELAMLVNASGAGNLAEACSATHCVLIQLSTDYVFDGSSDRPYKESDQVGPISVYGKSKLEGELAVEKATRAYYIFRLSWLYSRYGHNFYRSISNWLKEGRPLKITTDQQGTPTNAHEAATFILQWIIDGEQPYGCYHLTNSGYTTWYGFAKAIAELSPGRDPELVKPTDHYPTAAARPLFSVMNTQKAMTVSSAIMKHWRDSLEEVIIKDV
jgi:dTDP-4-dehydrorhamnose reductase